jgi:hypothetical protein
VEPTPRVVATPAQDTICDDEITDIVLTSPTRATLPVRFDYYVTAENPDSVNITTVSGRAGLLRGQSIQEQIDNLSDTAQQVTLRIWPYTVTPGGAERCVGDSITAIIWVEPTPRVVATPAQDTICDDEVTDILLTSATKATLPVQFDYYVQPEFPDSVNITPIGSRTGLLRGESIQEQLDNLSDTAQRVLFTITPYTVTPGGFVRCVGDTIVSTVWIEPTPRVVATPSQDTICDDEVTDILLTSPTKATLPVQFDYYVTAENPDSVNITSISGRAGLLRGDRAQEQIDNLSDTAQQVTLRIWPYTVTPGGADRRPGDPLTAII